MNLRCLFWDHHGFCLCSSYVLRYHLLDLSYCSLDEKFQGPAWDSFCCANGSSNTTCCNTNILILEYEYKIIYTYPRF